MGATAEEIIEGRGGAALTDLTSIRLASAAALAWSAGVMGPSGRS